jgi:Zn-finger nucleic acid-binding protein
VTLLCPKCMNPMRQYERNRVIVDQCTECGGLFLDRGGLEALAAAERAFYGQAAQVPAVDPQPMQAPIYDDRRYDDRGLSDHGFNDRRYDHDRRPYKDGYDGKSYKRRARSFLEDLFDD